MTSNEQKKTTSAPDMALKDWFEQEAALAAAQWNLDVRLAELSAELRAARARGDQAAVSRIRAQKQKLHKERRQ